VCRCDGQKVVFDLFCKTQDFANTNAKIARFSIELLDFVDIRKSLFEVVNLLWLINKLS